MSDVRSPSVWWHYKKKKCKLLFNLRLHPSCKVLIEVVNVEQMFHTSLKDKDC